MPKKIKQEKEIKYKRNERLLNVDNIHYFFLVLFILLVCICAGVGIYKYSEDKYHAHSGNPIVSFSYSEKVDDGYNVYSVNEVENKNIYATYSTLDGDKEKKWSRSKYLDFNEEIYQTNILESETQIRDEQESEPDWALEIELADGTQKYYSSNTENPIEKSGLAQIIQKYFDVEIIYK